MPQQKKPFGCLIRHIISDQKKQPESDVYSSNSMKAGWMLATTCLDGSSNIGFENSEVITEALGRMFINANVRAPISK